MSTQPTSKNTSDQDSLFEETVLSSDLGTVTFRQTKPGIVWLGLRRGNEVHEPPEISVQLTQRQQDTLADLLLDVKRERCRKR